MDFNDSEREQIDAFKQWWASYGKAIVVGVFLGLVALIGYQQWTAYTKSMGETASMEYELLIQALAQDDAQAVRDRGSRLVENYGSTPYANLAALALAKVYVEERDYAAAKGYLQRVLDKPGLAALEHVARLRMARLMLAEGDADGALSLLQAAQPGSFKGLYDELIGDSHLALDNREMARQAYEQALAADHHSDTATLEMKLDELGGAES